MTLALALASLLCAAPAAPEQPKDDDEWTLESWWKRGHTELTVGYLGELRDASTHPLELDASANDPAFAAALVSPFARAPFSSLRLSGPTIEARIVASHVRVTAGLRWPYTSFLASSTQQTADAGGSAHDVVVRSIALWDLRTGLGYEVPFSRVTPFIDVLGDVQHMTAHVVMDGKQAAYSGTSFGLGGRLGARIRLSNVFLQLAAEGTALGSPRYGGSVSVGGAI